ncbi:MAG: alpha-D-glucose phosphate-specific phosphoglucomutase [Hyphomicrobiales bacterium]|nr:alpha-D-glucose phosphate-specific phosphoglucomutase [Hyphomicrobiales bacterium]
MTIQTIETFPITGQKPGTSGLRKKTRVFMEDGYLENFVQSVFNAIDGAKNKTFVVGGDGRYYNKQAIQIILKMAAANGADKIIVGQNGVVSTPAVSHLIRLNKTNGGLILSASHNPGGIDEDFGVKFNGENGGPATENVSDKIYHNTTIINQYRIVNEEDVDLSKIGEQQIGDMIVEIVDPVADYLQLMKKLFDFDCIRALFASGFFLRFDAMHAVTGPYAKAILEGELGAEPGSVMNGVPLEDFGGGHPDPNPVWAKPLVDLMMSGSAPDFGAASDGDGDRNMIVGKGLYVTPSDSLAVLTANAHLVPAYKEGLAGVARSMPTSAACDRVAEKLGFESFETPTGWKFFGSLLDAGKVTLCGEESAGTGSNHVREKDGLWAVLLWLNILGKRKQSVVQILEEHWREFGRNYYSRHDYEAVPVDAANQLMDHVIENLTELPSRRFGTLTVSRADEFSYHDPVDGSVSSHQGIRIYFNGDARAVLRLSGTGTEGATVRLYLEQYVPSANIFNLSTTEVLKPVREAVLELAKFSSYLGRTRADVIS